MAVYLDCGRLPIAVLRVERPEVRNALDWEAMQAFAACVEQAAALPGLRALIVTGTTDAFIAGGDLRVLHQADSREDGRRLSAGMTLALDRLEQLPCPVIAAINGPARGGGAEVALACDLRVASEDATLSFAQIHLGLTPGWGGGQRLLRLVGYSRAFDLLATGRVLGAEEMLALGVVNRLAEKSRALEAAFALAEAMLRQSAEAVAAIKRLLRAGMELPPPLARAQEQQLFPPLWDSPAHHQAVARWLQNRRAKRA
ncbi:MAG: enoyl-CoA hydratase/isomerase family protein [Anaerolineae bacterium]|nr:MAG: enoyl-CoA hydratase/isomerase family protein [Anaerolineae bacterium]